MRNQFGFKSNINSLPIQNSIDIEYMMLRFLVFALLLILCVSCTSVKPYQREILSKPEMTFDDEKIEIGARQHFLNSLEGSSSSFGSGGGGCGCN